jgi:hypothetical protein
MVCGLGDVKSGQDNFDDLIWTNMYFQGHGNHHLQFSTKILL